MLTVIPCAVSLLFFSMFVSVVVPSFCFGLLSSAPAGAAVTSTRPAVPMAIRMLARGVNCSATAVGHRPDRTPGPVNGRLPRQPHGFEGLGAVEEVIGFDDEPVTDALHYGELLGVRRIALRTLANHACVRDEAPVTDIDQLVQVHRDRPDQLDQALHASERSR